MDRVDVTKVAKMLRAEIAPECTKPECGRPATEADVAAGVKEGTPIYCSRSCMYRELGTSAGRALGAETP